MDYCTVPIQELVVPACRVGLDRAILETNGPFLTMSGIVEPSELRGVSWCEALGLDPAPVNPAIERACARMIPVRLTGLRAIGTRNQCEIDCTAIPQTANGNSPVSLLLLFSFPRPGGRANADGPPDSRLEAANRTITKLDRQLAFIVEEKNREIRAAQEKLRQLYDGVSEELEMARTIQEALMPRKLPESINLKSGALYMPAGKVGGDFYDIIITPRQKIAVLIFDVSGHGVPAALIGAMAKMLFSHYIDKLESPADVFTNVNKGLCKFVKSEHYLTAFLGFINPIENVMTYSKAGHAPPVVFGARTGEVKVLESRGFFIGHTALADVVDYTDESISLEPEDKILFYTDGLTEGHNLAGELYGTRRLLELVAKKGSKPINSFLESILEDQTSFREGCPLRDDFTLVCVEIGSSDVFLKESGFSREDRPGILMVNSYEMIESIASVILREMDRKGYSDRQIKRTKVCVFEMLTNAIVHGNGSDPEKKAIILFRVSSERTAISVVDEGPGFDYTSVPDPLSPENLLKDSGRGLFIIRRYMDEVHFNKTGNRIMGILCHEERTEDHGTHD